ncbi:MAG TPA: hypothetical protein VHZ76_08840 [Gammaproteobacteria bacterium]|jgi:hypothetical protein|nr:hypothetical protein [Gammaproteobacteria bacterium]
MFNIIFDIDETLTTDSAEDFDKMELINELCTNPDRFVQALRPHFLHHGVLELIKAVLAIPEVNIHFFSADVEERNKPFVAELIKKAMGDDYYENHKTQTRIFSRPELIDVQKELESHPEKTESDYQPPYEIFKGHRKKDISLVNKEEQALKYTCLADDRPGITLKGQEKNYINILPFYPKYLDLNDFVHADEKTYQQSMHFKALNHIFYLAGFLIDAINLARQNTAKPLSMILFEKQFVKIDLFRYQPNFETLNSDMYYYEKGLSYLQQHNPHLELLTPQNLKEQLNLSSNLFAPSEQCKRITLTNTQ